MPPDRQDYEEASPEPAEVAGLVGDHLGQAATGETLVASSPRSVVVRVQLADGETVVAKTVGPAGSINRPSGVRVTEMTEAERQIEADARFATELAAYERLTATGCQSVPRLIGALPEARTLILEALDGSELVAVLAGDDRRGKVDALLALARALADIHGCGMTRPPTADDLDQVGLAKMSSLRTGTARLARETSHLDPEPALGELDGVVERLSRGGAFATWLHGDPCPGGNIFVAGDQARLVDLEAAGPGHAAVEAAYLRMGFPTCWCAGYLSEAVLAPVESAYRDALAPYCPSARDDEAWAVALADSCLWWALDGNTLVQRAERGRADLIDLALDRDWTWGTATARQRLVLRLSRAADALNVTGHAPALRQLVERAAQAVGSDRGPDFPDLGG